MQPSGRDLFALIFRVSISWLGATSVQTSYFRLAAAYCWGFVLISLQLCLAIPRVGLLPAWRFLTDFSQQSCWQAVRALAVLRSSDSFGQRTNRSTFTQASINKLLTALLLLSTEAQASELLDLQPLHRMRPNVECSRQARIVGLFPFNEKVSLLGATYLRA